MYGTFSPKVGSYRLALNHALNYGFTLRTALVPSETVCLAMSPVRRMRTAPWISREDRVTSSSSRTCLQLGPLDGDALEGETVRARVAGSEASQRARICRPCRRLCQSHHRQSRRHHRRSRRHHRRSRRHHRRSRRRPAAALRVTVRRNRRRGQGRVHIPLISPPASERRGSACASEG